MKKLNTQQWIAVVVAVFVVGFFFVFGQSVLNFFNEQKLNTTLMPSSLGGLKSVDTLIGGGDVAEVGNRVTVNYVGHFPDGTVFDSSVARNEPFQFVLGAGKVIEGWDKGIIGMRVGGTRTLTVPPDMGYGANDYGPIPGNSTLIFEVQLLKVEK